MQHKVAAPEEGGHTVARPSHRVSYRRTTMMPFSLALLAVLLGALVRGYTGFGASMFWVSSLSLIYPPTSVVPTVLLLEVVAGLLLVPMVVVDVKWREMVVLLAATAATMPLGVVLLSVLPARGMRLVVAVALLGATAAMAMGVNLAGRPGLRSILTAGSVTGVITGGTGIGGPPAVLLYFGDAADQVKRATLIAYFLGADAVGVAMMAVARLLNTDVLLHTAAFTPVALLGTAFGQWIHRRRGQRGFRRVVIGVLVALSLGLLLRAIRG